MLCVRHSPESSTSGDSLFLAINLKGCQKKKKKINECLKYFLRGLFCKIVVDKVQTFCQRIKLKMFSSGNEFSGQLFVRCSPIALAPPPSTPLLTKLYIFRPTWINLEAEIHVWKNRSKLTTKSKLVVEEIRLHRARAVQHESGGPTRGAGNLTILYRPRPNQT